MSTFRIARHGVDMDTGDVGVDRRAVAVVIVLCAALFAGCFAIGRAASPKGRPVGESAPSLPVAFAGAAVPLRLSSAPAIQLRRAAPKHHAPRAPESSSVAVAAAGARAIVRAPTPVAPTVPSPARQVASAPAPVPTHTAPAGARGGEGGGGGEKSSPPHTSSGSGTSFDSSG
jgi:hypothetical protein